MTQFLPLTAGGLTYVLSYDPSVTLDVAATNGTVDVEVVSGSGSDGTYAQGSVLRLIGHANEGYCFSAFSGDLVSSLNMQTITMDGNKSVTASFSAIVGNAVAINAAWIAAAGAGPYYLDSDYTTYTLHQDVTTDGTAFAIIDDHITFDLNGYTITYDNAAPITVANGSFEAGTGSVATGWDFTHAPNAERFDGEYLQNEVYDGDYSLKFSSFTGDQYVVSTDTVTLEANTTYSLSGMFWNGNTNWADGVSTYAKLVGQNVASEHIVSWANPNWRGIQLTESVFTTGDTAETYKIVVGANNPTGAADYTAYIDDIKIQRTKTYGVAVSAKSWDPDSYPGVMRYGEAPKATIKNGAILQGRDNATWAHGIYSRQTYDISVDDMSITVAGANSSALRGQDGTSWVITDNDLTSNVRTITSRDNFHGTVIYNVGGTISRNTIHNGPHAGIYASQGNSTIDNNVIQLKTKYTNAFAIVMRNASEAHHNTINCGVGEFAARGIQISGNTTGNTAKIHHNTITVQGTTDNQEYGGAQIGGFYGIQIENCSDVEVYENTVTAIASVTDAAAFRMNVDGADSGSNVYVHDNTFIGQRTGTGVGAAPLMFTNVSGHEVTFEHNTLESNSLFVRRSRACSDIVLSFSTLKATGDLAELIPIESYNWDFQQLHIIENLKWVDNSYYDAASQTLLKNASVLNFNGAVDPYSSFIHSFTTTLRVVDGSDTPLAGAAVVLTDKDDAEVYSGETGDDGTVDVVVDEFRTVGDVKTSYSPYTLSATHGELSGSQEFTADQIQTITAVVE